MARTSPGSCDCAQDDIGGAVAPTKPDATRHTGELYGRATVLGKIVIQASFCAQSQNLAGDGADLARILDCAQDDIDGAAQDDIDGAAQDDIDGAAQDDIDGAAQDDIDGAAQDDIDGAAQDDIDGAAQDDIGGAAQDDIGGAAQDDIGGAAQDDIGGAVARTEKFCATTRIGVLLLNA